MKQKARHEMEDQDKEPSTEFALKKCRQWAQEDCIPPDEMDAYIRDCLKYFSTEDF